MSEKAILVLKTGETLPPVMERRGDFEDWIFEGLGTDVVVASVYDGDAIPEIGELAGVVVTGSPAMVTERLEWSEASGRWLAEIVRSDAMPVLGICYGHQLLAQALGGEVGVNPNGREMGTVEVEYLADAEPLGPLFESGVFGAQMSHVESVLRPPPGARVLAKTACDPHSVLVFGPRQWGVQFHPEFDREITQLYIGARSEILRAEGFDPDDLIDSAVETPESARVLERFGALVRSGR